MMGKCPTPSLLPSAPFPSPLILHQCKPLVGCCIPPSNGGNLRSRSRPSLSFSMGAILGPHAREKEWRERACQTGSLHRTHGEPRHRDFWSMANVVMEREGKAAGIRVAAAHVGCCVCCVLCFAVVFCVGGQLLATILVGSQHQPRQNGRLVRNHIIKSVPKDPQY